MTPSNALQSPHGPLAVREDDLRRKGEQRGSIRRTRTSWHIEFKAWLDDGHGKLVYKLTSRKVGPAIGPDRLTKRQAEQLGYEMFVMPANGMSAGVKGVATLRQFVETRFRPDRIDRMRKSGRLHYSTMLRAHLLPAFGDCKLTDIQPHMVQQFVSAKLKFGLSTQTVLHIKNALSAVLRYAKQIQFLRGDLPTEYVVLPQMVRKPRRALTREQVAMLVAEMPERYRPLILMMAQLGLRIGEATGLRWKWVNLDDEYRVVDGEAIPPYSIAVRESFVRGEWRPLLKSRHSQRTLPLPATLWVELSLHLARTKFHAPEHPVFANRVGDPLDGHNLASRYLKPAARKIGLPWVHFHCLRHTAATHLDPLMSATEKQRMLGHGSVEMGSQYTHPELNRLRGVLDEAASKRLM